MGPALLWRISRKIAVTFDFKPSENFRIFRLHSKHPVYQTLWTRGEEYQGFLVSRAFSLACPSRLQTREKDLETSNPGLMESFFFFLINGLMMKSQVANSVYSFTKWSESRVLLFKKWVFQNLSMAQERFTMKYGETRVACSSGLLWTTCG